MNNKKSVSDILISIFTPIFILVICIGITVVCAIKPYNKISTYLNLAFMDDLKTVPESNGITAGLHIKDNEILDDYNGGFSETGEVIRPEFGEKFAKITSSKLELNVPVYWGSNSEIFERGACQASHSVLPGEEGNAVISAHVNTFFSDLYKLEEGDDITIVTNYGTFKYEVTEKIQFNKNDKKYIIPKQEEILTLYTCKPDVLGSSDIRTGVVCKITEKKFYTEVKEKE